MCAAAVAIAVCVCMLLLLLCVPCRQAPTPPLLVSVMVYALPQTHSILGYCGTLSCVVCTLLSSGCWGSLCLLLLSVCTMQAPCYDNSAIPTRAGLQGVSNTSPARGRPVANILAVPLPRVRVYR